MGSKMLMVCSLNVLVIKIRSFPISRERFLKMLNAQVDTPRFTRGYFLEQHDDHLCGPSKDCTG